MTVTIAAQCPLCGGGANVLLEISAKTYHKCARCAGVFLDQACCISREAEKRRYEEHNNDVDDPGYQKFVAPVVLKVQEMFRPEHRGLDYGAGTGPVVAKILRDKGYRLQLYDPYFWNTPEVLKETYDYIVCCEVIEHFNAPAKEFRRLRSLLTPRGVLFCMTDLYSEDTDFKKWYYRNDPTHIFFYHEKTLMWIKGRFGFMALEQQGRLSLFY